jgi:hypothetical protein
MRLKREKKKDIKKFQSTTNTFKTELDKESKKVTFMSKLFYLILLNS